MANDYFDMTNQSDEFQWEEIARGAPGISPTVTVTDLTNGHRVTITDVTHPQGQSFDVPNGEVTQAAFDELSGDVDYLKSAVNEQGQQLSSTSDYGWVRGHIAEATGAEVNATTVGQSYARSDYFPLSNVSITVANPLSWEFRVYYWAGNTYLGVAAYRNTPLNVEAYANENYPTATQFRITVHCTNGISELSEIPEAIWIINKISELSEYVNDLNSAMVHNDDCLFVTSDSITTDGITIEKISDTSFRVYGVATAARYITLFNNLEIVKTSTQTVNKIVPPGECEVAITTNLPTIKLRYAAGDTWSSAAPLENGNVVFSSNVGVCFLSNKNVDYGTSESPTIVDIRIKRKVVSAEPWLLSPSGGDDAPAIWLNLYCYGQCELTEGIYHTATMRMPENTILSGCGNKTVLITAEANGVYMTNGCVVRDLALDGGGQDDVIPTEDGGRSGIVIAVADVRRVRIDNCYIHGFSGSAIVARDIGTGIRTDIVISRCNLWYNFRGIYLRRNAEFIMISDCNICCNYYGILNRGGNNKFSNCDIDSNIINAQIDQDEGSNGGHGSMVGCSFNHSNNRGNDGYSLIINGTGRMNITGCQFHYGAVLLENTDGNVFSGCNFGHTAGIEVVNGRCSIFTGCMFISAFTENPVTRTNNTTAVFANCYTRQGVIFTGN